MKAHVNVMLKNGVLDPQGDAINHALGTLGYDSVLSVRQGKIIELELDENDAEVAEKKVRGMCENLLANTVIESYSIEISG